MIKIYIKDSHEKNRASAIDLLATTNNADYTNLYLAGIKDSSYSVAGASLSALALTKPAKALSLLSDIKNDAKGRLKSAVQEAEVPSKTDADFDEVNEKFDKSSVLEKASQYKAYVIYLGNVYNNENLK
ncbi:MAG: HEAT repeat domain-containing protein, partial [Segetibacter sp.]